jgi:hypothetical protein
MRNITKLCTATAGISTLGIVKVQAALDPAIQTTLDGLAVDVVELGGYVIGAVAIVASIILGVRLLPKVVKRVASWF